MSKHSQLRRSYLNVSPYNVSEDKGTMKKGDIVVCVKCDNIDRDGPVSNYSYGHPIQLTYGKQYEVFYASQWRDFKGVELIDNKKVIVRDDKGLLRDYITDSFKLLSECRENKLNELGI
jgi:hypothetical protein